MDKLTVRQMTSTEFEAFRTRTDREYAAEQVIAGNWTVEEVDRRSAELTDQLLPQGVDTPRMLFLAGEIPNGVVVGHVWVALDPQPGSSTGASSMNPLDIRSHPCV